MTEYCQYRTPIDSGIEHLWLLNQRTIKLGILWLLMKELSTTYRLGKRIKLGSDEASLSSSQHAGKAEGYTYCSMSTQSAESMLWETATGQTI